MAYKYYQDKNGNTSSGRVNTAIILFFAAVGFVWTAIAPVFHIVVSSGFITLTEVLILAGAGLNIGSKWSERK